MRRVIIFFFISIFLFLLSKYIFDNLSPFNFSILNNTVIINKIKPNDWQELNKQLLILVRNGEILKYLSSNAYLGILIFSSALTCMFASIHLTIDKIFFKNFYERASLANALRRGLLLFISLFFIIYFKLYGLESYIIIAIPLLFILIEILYTLYINKVIINRLSPLINTFKKIMNESTKVKK